MLLFYPLHVHTEIDDKAPSTGQSRSCEANKAIAKNKQTPVETTGVHVYIQWWIGGLSLLEEDREVLRSGKELTGNIINAAQLILSNSYPQIGGFQDTSYGRNLKFLPVDPHCSNIQILHTGLNLCTIIFVIKSPIPFFLGASNHWLCTFSKRCSAPVVYIADSLGLFMKLDSTTLLQIAKLYGSILPSQNASEVTSLPVCKLSVQQQIGTLDCGLYAIAFAVDLCMGKNPKYSHFDQSKMREHLEVCLAKGKFQLFPTISSDQETLPRPKSRVIKIKLYCECRLPEEYDEEMVCCDGCTGWYHLRCMNMSNHQIPKNWKCSLCA